MISDEDKAKIKAYLLKIRTDHNYQLKIFPENAIGPRYEFSVGQNMYFLGIKGNKALNEISDLLLKDSSIESNFSRNTLISELKPLIAKIIEAKPRGIDKFSKDSLDNFLQELDLRLTQWEIITPVTNLTLTEDCFRIGRVNFRRNVQDILETFRKIMGNTESQPEVKKYISDELIPRYQGKVLAFVTLSAKDKNNALQVGHEEIDRAINVLRFYGRGTQENDSISYRMRIAREGYVFHGLSISLYSDRVENPSTTAFNLNFTHTGFLFPYVIDNQVLDKMNSFSYDIIDKMLKKEYNNCTDFEKKVLDALEWEYMKSNLLFHLSISSFLLNCYSLIRGNHKKD